MWKLIELDAVMKILKEHYPDAFEWVLYDFIFKIKALPQIDIVWEIEKMIEEYENEQKRISKWSSLHYDLSMYIKTLQELLQKFKS